MSLIKKPYEIEESPLVCMFYGQPGIGKTTLALSAPNPLLIDLDHGSTRVEKSFLKDYVSVKTYQDVLNVLSSQDAIKSYDTIIIDTLGKLINIMADFLSAKSPNIRQSDGTLSIKGWGILKMNFQNLFSQLRSLNKHLIFIAHAREEKDGDAKNIRPDAAGSSCDYLVTELDILGYVKSMNNKRTISFNPHDAFYAKNSYRLEDDINISDPHTSGNNFFEKVILKKVEEFRQSSAELTEKYHNLVSSQKEKINNIKTKDDLNVAYANLKNEEQIWDSETVWKHLLNDKLKELGATFDKSNGVFI